MYFNLKSKFKFNTFFSTDVYENKFKIKKLKARERERRGGITEDLPVLINYLRCNLLAKRYIIVSATIQHSCKFLVAHRGWEKAVWHTDLATRISGGVFNILIVTIFETRHYQYTVTLYRTSCLPCKMNLRACSNYATRAIQL